MILIILVGGDARDLGVQGGQVVRGGGLVSPGPGGEGGVVLGAQQEAGAGPRTELPVVEDRSHPTPPRPATSACLRQSRAAAGPAACPAETPSHCK